MVDIPSGVYPMSSYADSLWIVAREVLTAQSDSTPWLATADEFADRTGQEGYDGAGEMETLLRGFVECQTFVRMSLPIPTELTMRMTKAQEKFTTAPTLQSGRAVYSRPFGPYYLALTIPAPTLAANFDLLSAQPVRYVTITDCEANDDLALFMRNYRMNNQFEVNFRFRSQPRNIMTVAKAVLQGTFYWSDRISMNILDVNRMVAAHFCLAKSICRGTRLFMGRPPTLSTTK